MKINCKLPYFSTSRFKNGSIKKKVIGTYKEFGIEMPEDLPSQEKSVKSIEKEQAKSEKK